MKKAAAPSPPVPPVRPRLAREFTELVADSSKPAAIHDVVIVGSGYGGSVAAQALAGLEKKGSNGEFMPISVCVLERGSEYLPGEFPKRFEDLPGHLRRTNETTGLVTGNLEGLFDVRMGPDVVALVASGVGGGSLINAGVLLEPDLADFDPASEAHALVADLKQRGWYDKACTALGGRSKRGRKSVENTIALHPDAGRVRKTAALSTLGTGMVTPNLSVAMAPGPNHADVELSACELCGDCMTGCNVGAKDSLDANLLDLAVRAGAKVYTGASVLMVKRNTRKGVWTLQVAHTSNCLQKREAGPAEIHARHVILAAGTLGSTEILLRSRNDDLMFSPRLGQGFSCNGDNLAAVYDMGRPTQGCADEDHPLRGRFVGPTITGSVTMHTTSPGTGATPGRRSFQLQEFAIPGAMKRIFEEVVTTAKVFNDIPRSDVSQHGAEARDALDPMAVDDEAMNRTLLVGTIGHDAADGVLYLPHPLPPLTEPAQQGTISVHWQDARVGARLEKAHRRVEDAVANLRDEGEPTPILVANPIWRLLPAKLESLVSQPRGPVLTVHPLGGCRIGPRDMTASSAGVVDGFGRVHDFSDSRRRSWFGTLVVLDGSIIPGSLGVNPSLTITATAMRAMETLRKDWGYRPPKAAAPLPKAAGRVIWARRRAPEAQLSQFSTPLEPPAGRGGTEIQIVERLRGPVPLTFGGRTRKCIVELTLAYRPLPIGDLMGKLQRQMTVDASDEASRIRIYDEREWNEHHLKLEDDDVRSHWAFFEGRLSGTLSVLGREPSGPLRRVARSVSSWLLNRGTRDIAQRFTERTQAQQQGQGEGLVGYVGALLRMGTRAGEARRLDYDLTIAEVLPPVGSRSNVNARGLGIGLHDEICASKRLTFGRRANPWRQLTLLSIDKMPAMHARRPPVLELDGRFLAGQGFPLLRITKQRNSAVALADLASFGLYMARVLVTIHLWTFRKPDNQPRRKPDRLPGPVAGLTEPEVTVLEVDRYPDTDKPVTIRLTRYRQPIGPKLDSGTKPGRPLVMIHGYSASGNTFTHPSLPTGAAAYFCEQGRDVWVVDLRTSSGLPSCTHPWSMEQVGLIDIPAALLHIRDVTNQQVDVLAHCIGCVMLSMALLTDAREVRNSKIELGPDAWLTRSQLGTLKAFNTRDAGQAQHPVVRKLILSQKGPVLRYTDDNILRAFLLQSLRRWLMRDDYQFQPSDDPGVTEQLMDRLLASIPYPSADYDIENPLWPLARVPWTATRHRMDALYGRAFDAANMSAKTLAVIDDIFGPINLETVSQTIHFARINAITNQAGRGEFVTRDRLHERWGGIDTYAIHGANNGLVDELTQTLLSEHLRSAGVSFSEPNRRAKAEVYGKLGHQDVLMGISSDAVFDDLQRFLERSPATVPQECLPDVVTLPWSGPRFALPRKPGGKVRLACLSNPTQGEGRLYLVPVVRETNAQGDRGYRLVDDVDCIGSSKAGGSARWMFAEPLAPKMALHKAALKWGRVADTALGWLALVIYPAGETIARLPAHDRAQASASAPKPKPVQAGKAGASAPRKTSAAPLAGVPRLDQISSSGPGRRDLKVDTRRIARWVKLVGVASARHVASKTAASRAPKGADGRRDVLDLVGAWLERQCSEDVDLAFVALADVETARATAAAKKPGESFTFTLGSCQYVTGLVDAKVGQASLHQLAGAIDTPDQPYRRVELALFVGDQIYADATAGLIDPTRRDELYDQPNDKAMRAAGMRAVLRRVPARMLLDDHELRDNWEPLPREVARLRPKAQQRNEAALERGARAWAKYQRMWPLGKKTDCHGAGDLEFTAGGVAFRFTDTRTGRSARGSTTRAEDRKILNRNQWRQLRKWLEAQGDRIKFIVTPSILLPRCRRTADGDGGAPHSDAWDGFPVSMDELFAFIVEKQIKNTVFLSGDVHHSMIAEAVIASRRDPTKPPVKIVSVHSSGLYAPFQFANGRPEDLAQHDSFSLPGVTVDAHTRFAPAGEGFARLQAHQDGGEWMLRVEWIKSGGEVIPENDIALRAPR